MIRNSFKALVFIFVILFFASTGFADAQIGRLLQEAMAAREAGTVSDVSDKFIIAANSTSSTKLKSDILFIFSDYLMDKEEWEKTIQVQHQIIGYGNQVSQGSALYNLIRANLELNQIDKAKIAAAELNNCVAGDSVRENAHTMKKLDPGSIHARISDLLVETSSNGDIARSSQDDAQPSSSSGQIATETQVEAMPSQEKQASEKFDSRGFSVMAGGWNSSLRGDLNSQGMSLDFGDDLSSKRQTSLSLSAEISPNPKDRFKATYVNFSFNGTLNRAIVHNARTYNPGANFFMRTRFVDLEGFRELKRRNSFNWGALYGIMLTDSNLEIAQNISGARQITTWESRFGYPYLGLAARSNYPGNIGWDASIKLFAWNGDGRYKTHDLELKLLFGQSSKRKSSALKFRGYLGYRDFCWDGDFGEDAIWVVFSGPILGLEFFF